MPCPSTGRALRLPDVHQLCAARRAPPPPPVAALTPPLPPRPQTTSAVRLASCSLAAPAHPLPISPLPFLLPMACRRHPEGVRACATRDSRRPAAPTRADPSCSPDAVSARSATCARRWRTTSASTRLCRRKGALLQFQLCRRAFSLSSPLTRSPRPARSLGLDKCIETAKARMARYQVRAVRHAPRCRRFASHAPRPVRPQVTPNMLIVPPEASSQS